MYGFDHRAGRRGMYGSGAYFASQGLDAGRSQQVPHGWHRGSIYYRSGPFEFWCEFELFGSLEVKVHKDKVPAAARTLDTLTPKREALGASM